MQQLRTGAIKSINSSLISKKMISHENFFDNTRINTNNCVTQKITKNQ